MSLGLILLMAAAVLILLGAAQRVLDKLRLTDRQALLLTALIFIGGIMGDIPLGDRLSVNLGGAVIPLGLCAYLLVKAETGKERLRALMAAAVTALAVWLIGHYFPDEPETMPFDVNYLYGLAGGLIAWLFGRSRRSAFVAGVLGVAAADIAQALVNWARGIDQRLALGGAGAVDAIVLSGLSAVLLAELVGEIAEGMAMRKRPWGAFEEARFIRGEKRK